ncbi:MAG: hypothetical protein HYU70_16315 [Bacteroidetes bacterium]|nr:hypothetical protein [Bacteroidota bacterium]
MAKAEVLTYLDETLAVKDASIREEIYAQFGGHFTGLQDASEALNAGRFEDFMTEAIAFQTSNYLDRVSLLSPKSEEAWKTIVPELAAQGFSDYGEKQIVREFLRANLVCLRPCGARDVLQPDLQLPETVGGNVITPLVPLDRAVMRRELKR